MKIRSLIFLRDVFLLAITAFGGPQAHIAMFIDHLVRKRAYLTEEELLELYALCQILPGPTSTQTITAIGFKRGGPGLAYLTLLIWVLPAFTIMTAAAILISQLQDRNIGFNFTRFIQPMAVGFIAYAAFKISTKVVKSKTAIALMILAAVVSYLLTTELDPNILPFALPFLLLGSGAVTAIKFKAQPIEEKEPLKIQWSNFFVWLTVFIVAATLGGITQALPIRLFENFYRNGSLIFGGGQVLIPLMYTEFVEFKEYLSSSEFLTGIAIMQSVPGPVFSISGYIGALSMREYSIGGEILGAILATAGIFLPGTFLIFFIIRFWSSLKKYRIVRASLEGINAASSGLIITAAILLFKPIDPDIINLAYLLGTFLILAFTRIPTPLVIILGLVSGFAVDSFM